MKAIKWTGPKHYPSFGVIQSGDIITEEKISVEVMEKWIGQGLAEWFVAPAEFGPVKEIKKRKAGGKHGH